jgi:hypothetical protein
MRKQGIFVLINCLKMQIHNQVLLFFPTAVLLFALSVTSVSREIPAGITDSFKKGDSRSLARHFNDNIELVILANEDVYSKSQAELILRNFFSENRPTGFDLLHSGGKETRFAIGNLRTVKGDFRIYFLLKQKGSESLIHLLRIEKMEDALLNIDSRITGET